MEISPISNVSAPLNNISHSNQTTSLENTSSFIYINEKDDDEEKTIIAFSTESEFRSIASEYYRDSLGRPALGTYNEAGTIQGISNTLGSSLNIAC